MFVGYSVSHPVMSYMVDALAAERVKGAQFADAYAFADYDGTPAGLAKALDTWRVKNVDPRGHLGGCNGPPHFAPHLAAS